MKKLVLVLALAAAVGAAYWMWGRPEQRACRNLASLCGVETRADCDELFATLSRQAPEDAAKAARCINEATSCAGAAGCTAGSALRLGAGMLKDFAEGVGKSLGK